MINYTFKIRLLLCIMYQITTKILCEYKIKNLCWYLKKQKTYDKR